MNFCSVCIDSDCKALSLAIAVRGIHLTAGGNQMQYGFTVLPVETFPLLPKAKLVLDLATQEE